MVVGWAPFAPAGFAAAPTAAASVASSALVIRMRGMPTSAVMPPDALRAIVTEMPWRAARVATTTKPREREIDSPIAGGLASSALALSS